MTPRDVLVLCREKDIKSVQLCFSDFLGSSYRITIPVTKLTMTSFEDGIGLDVSRIAGWKMGSEVDIVLVPQAESAFVDPRSHLPTLNLICSIHDSLERIEHKLDSRSVTRRASLYLKEIGIAHRLTVGLDGEFFMVPNHASHVGSRPKKERHAGSFGNRKPAMAATASGDIGGDFRDELMLAMLDCGVAIHAHGHYSGPIPQMFFSLGHEESVRAADHWFCLKNAAKTMARKWNASVTFMPKPFGQARGSGLHVSLSLLNESDSLFKGHGLLGLSDVGLNAVAGILHHARALQAFSNPSTNSYRRLADPSDAPMHIAWSERSTSTFVRIPAAGLGENEKVIQLRFPDATCNSYLLIAACLMAAIDGIQNKLPPGDVFREEEGEHLDAPRGCKSLEEALDSLQSDHHFLLRGEVFTDDMIQEWCKARRQLDVEPLQIKPHPIEFKRSFDC